MKHITKQSVGESKLSLPLATFSQPRTIPSPYHKSHSSKRIAKMPGSWQDERVAANEQKENKVADEYGAPDVYVDGEEDTCWYHWTGSIYVKPMRFENRSGCYVRIPMNEIRPRLGPSCRTWQAPPPRHCKSLFDQRQLGLP